MRVLALELRLFLAERVTWVLLLVFTGTLVYGIVNGANAGEISRELAQTAQTRSDEWNTQVAQALETQSLEPRQVAGRPAEAILPPAPLPALAVGQSDLLSPNELISLFQLEKPTQGRSELENPARLLAGRFDLAFVLVWLFPLFLLAACYDLCAGDREAGTLRLVLAQGTSPLVWIGRRAFARGTPMFALAIAATLVPGMLSDSEAIGMRVVLAVAVVLAYGFFWLSIAVLVNSFARSAASAATAVGSIWVVFVLVLPTLLNVVVESLHPSPARAELVAEERAASGAAEQRGSELFSTFYRDHPELAPPGMQGDMLGQILAVQDEVGRALDPVRAKFAEAIRKQQKLVDLWRFASPAISIHEGLADLAGTGYWRHRSFQDQVEVFKEDLHEFYSPKIHKRQPLTKADIPNLPNFEFVEEAPASLSARVGTGLAGILALTLLAMIVAGQRLSARKLAA